MIFVTFWAESTHLYTSFYVSFEIVFKMDIKVVKNTSMEIHG